MKRTPMTVRGAEASASAPEYAAQYFRSEMAKYARLVKIAGVELQ